MNITTTITTAPAVSNILPVFVRRTEVALGSVEIPALLPVESSMANGIAYDGRRRRLFVHFKKGGNVFVYRKVSRAQFDALMQADSFGKAFKPFIDNAAHKAVRVAEKFTA